MVSFKELLGSENDRLQPYLPYRKRGPVFVLFAAYCLYAVFIYGRVLLFQNTQAVYTNESHQYSIVYPKKWTSNSYPNGYKNQPDLQIQITDSDYLGIVKPLTKKVEIYHKAFDYGEMESVILWGDTIIESNGGGSVQPLQSITFGADTYEGKMRIVDTDKYRSRYIYIFTEGDGFIIHFQTDTRYDRNDWVTIFRPILDSFHP